jgi:nickel superoxide dismutase
MTTHTAEPATPRRHCQVPCGIYGDRIRIDLLMEDAATIAKGMAQIKQLGDAGAKNYNQIVRWVTTKDEHANKVQKMVADYWLAQRIKAPKTGADQSKYLKQLQLMHGITVAAMKCKQTIDPSWPEKMKAHVLAFSKTYFDKKDLEHIESHHKGGHK